jgi:hypothetical protein
VVSADLARYDAMAEALLAPDFAYHLLLAGLCRRTESQDFCSVIETATFSDFGAA